jgi:hypothetical protein
MPLHALLWMVTVAVGALAPAEPDPLFVRATEYVAAFERTFAAVTWREQYEQEDRMQRRFGSSGASGMQLVGKRRLESQLLFVWLPREASWIAVRDVMSVDGKARAEAERPLQKMSLGGSSISVAELKTLAAENGRFNIGKIERTFNEPTLALSFLDDRYRHRFEFEFVVEQKLETGPMRLYRYIERGRPTVIRIGDRDLPAQGLFGIQPETGRILFTSLRVSDAGNVHGHVSVRYGPHADFDVLVPIEMKEVYTSIAGEEVTATATYSDFRRFEAHSRIIVPQ